MKCGHTEDNRLENDGCATCHLLEGIESRDEEIAKLEKVADAARRWLADTAYIRRDMADEIAMVSGSVKALIAAVEELDAPTASVSGDPVATFDKAFAGTTWTDDEARRYGEIPAHLCDPRPSEASYPNDCKLHPESHYEMRCVACVDDLARFRARAETWIDEDDKPLPEDAAIKAAFPTRSERHDLYAEARRLVSARYSKNSLIALVNWLLHRIESPPTGSGGGT